MARNDFIIPETTHMGPIYYFQCGGSVSRGLVSEHVANLSSRRGMPTKVIATGCSNSNNHIAGDSALDCCAFQPAAAR